MHQYTIERISPASLHHIQTLYHSIYSKTLSTKSLAGKYTTKIFGVEWLGYLAFTHNKKPAAFYGVIPCHFKIRDEIFLAAQSADTMTHPDHQRQGLFTQLAKKTYELARQEGVQFIFGFPNENSYAGFVKLNWKFMERPMQLFLLKGSKLPWASLLLKTPILRDVYEQMMEKRFGHVNENGELSDHHGVIRNALFFKYKNQYTKTFVKKCNGVFAWIKNDGLLKVGLLSLGDASPEAIESFLRHMANSLGCHSIVLMTSCNTELYKTLIKITSPSDGLPIGFYNLTNRDLHFSDVRFEYCDIDIF
jgi:GNAT superfamily N-acetyltransferase